MYNDIPKTLPGLLTMNFHLVFNVF